MSTTCRSHLAIVLFAIAATTLSAQTPVSSVETAPPSAHPREVYPQIVRLSLVQGDVRVAVGKQKEQPDVAPWVEGAVNLPLETGFSVVTGKGRAEIEFEDASTMYLGENSALAFDALTTKDGVPHTEMTLLAGVAVLNLHPTVQGETYLVETPNDYVRVPSGRHASLRLNAYTDTTTLTPLSFAEERSGAPTSPVIGHTFTFRDHVLEPAPAGPDKAEDVAFDTWATKRIEERSAAMHAVMKDTGLNEPQPGLADMEAKGTFFPCKPYGTCWEPTNGWGTKHAGAGAKAGVVQVSAQVPAQTQQRPTQESLAQEPVPTKEQLQDAKLAQKAQTDEEEAEEQTSGGVAPGLWVEDEDVFPCSPYALEDLMGQDPVTGDVNVLDSQVVWNDGWFDGYGFDWAVCHTGSWVYWRHRYAWVAGRHHHHHPPVHWVKVNGKLGYVPIHPRDEKGKEPENLHHGIFVRAQQKGGTVQLVAWNSKTPVKVLGETPKEFREPSFQKLHATSAPTLEAHRLMGGTEHGKAVAATSLIAFDSKAKGFTVSTQMNEGGRSHTVVDRFSGAGGRGFSGGGSGSGHFGGGSAGGGGHFGGGSSGGGHFGGGGSSGGGGSHGGGGGSVSSASSSGGGASAGGGHH